MNHQNFKIRSYSASESQYYKLPSVKQCLYHPQLPTFRRMDIDTAAHKLPDAHCRTTTPCSARDFQKATVTLHIKPINFYPNKENSNVNKYWRYKHLYSYVNPTTKEKEDDEHEESDVANGKNDGTSETSASNAFEAKRLNQKQWKFVLRQEPYIDHIGQRPIPATIFSRYRSLSSSYGGQVSTANWRP